MIVRDASKVDFRPDPTILLQPQLVKPLHGLNPRTIRGSEWWDGERRAAYRSTGYRCLACAQQNVRLEAHEQYAIDFERCPYLYERAVPLCRQCHQFIHLGRCSALVENGEMGVREFRAIEQRGNVLLRCAGLDKDRHLMQLCGGDSSRFFPERDGTWNRWHLRIDGHDHYSRFRDVEEWALHYSNERIVDEQPETE